MGTSRAPFFGTPGAIPIRGCKRRTACADTMAANLAASIAHSSRPKPGLALVRFRVVLERRVVRATSGSMGGLGPGGWGDGWVAGRAAGWRAGRMLGSTDGWLGQLYQTLPGGALKDRCEAALNEEKRSLGNPCADSAFEAQTRTNIGSACPKSERTSNTVRKSIEDVGPEPLGAHVGRRAQTRVARTAHRQVPPATRLPPVAPLHGPGSRGWPASPAILPTSSPPPACFTRNRLSVRWYGSSCLHASLGLPSLRTSRFLRSFTFGLSQTMAGHPRSTSAPYDFHIGWLPLAIRRACPSNGTQAPHRC